MLHTVGRWSRSFLRSGELKFAASASRKCKGGKLRTLASSTDDQVEEAKLFCSKKKNRVSFCINNKEVNVQSSDELVYQAERGDFTGGRIWNVAAGSLVEHLIRNPHLVKNKRIIELGSGTGIGGLAAAALGAKLALLTDRRPEESSYSVSSDGEVERIIIGKSESILKNLRLNVELNKHVLKDCEVHVGELEWGNEEHINKALEYGPFDLAIGADLIYSPEIEVQIMLAKTIAFVTCNWKKPKAILSWQQRLPKLKENMKLAAEDFGLVIEEIPISIKEAQLEHPLHLEYYF